MNRDDGPRKRCKKKYQRPRLRAIALVAEEVLGVGCKDGSGSAPGQPCVTLNCAAIGS